MLKETVTYIDFNGVERTENYHFHLNEAELMEMELGTAGGMAEQIQNIIDANDTPAIVAIFKKLLLSAYGVKSADGKRFIKNDELRAEFEQSPAYPKIFMKLSTDADAAAKFINGIIPADLAAKAAAALPAAN